MKTLRGEHPVFWLPPGAKALSSEGGAPSLLAPPPPPPPPGAKMLSSEGEYPVFWLPPGAKMRGRTHFSGSSQERRCSPGRGEHPFLWFLQGAKMLSAWALKVLTAPWSHSTGFELASRLSPFPPPWLRLSENLVASDHPLIGTSYVTLVLSTACFASQNNSHGAKPMDMSLSYI